VWPRRVWILAGGKLDCITNQKGNGPMTNDNSTMSGRDIHRDESQNLISAERVKGTAVYDTAGDKIGSIDSVMLAKRSGKVAYAIMSFGGFLGVGEKYHPLPWDMLDYDTDLGGYRVATAGRDLKDAPAFGRADFEMSDTDGSGWQSDTDRYYGRAGAMNGSTGSGLGGSTDRL
jgi:hypothetical protein